MKATYKYRDRLETKRLLTRFLTAEDYLIWADFFNDKEAIEFLPTFGLTSALDRAKHWVERQLTRYKEKQFGLQALINKETKEFIGQCGLVKQEVDGEAEIEVGYHIFKKYWGNGYATEAARVFIDYALQNNLTNSIISIIDIRNIKSQRVADKNGLTREKQIKWSGSDVYIYRISKER
ncbi:MAG: GNAT family N-acetyltransferase [Thermoproteota archaeon]|nr:GNAT family N-acetyltransferase [Thermoproteota archaeon]